jgi:hypothetical protein
MKPTYLLAFCLWTIFGAVASAAERPLQPDPLATAREVDAILLEEVHGGDASRLAPIASDEVFLRRISLDIIGRNPTPVEVLDFVLDADPAKRSKLVAKLLDDPRYGENWAGYWRDAIMYRRSEDRALLAAGALEEFLKEEFNKNSPWSEIVTAFITAEGDVREEGATGLIMAQGGMPEETTAEVARLFLGIQIQCAQCHDHPTDRWKREEFHQLTAFFPRVAVRPKRDGEQRSFEVAANDGPGFTGGNNMNRFRGTPEHFMPDLDRPEERGLRMQPVFFLSGEKLEFGVRDAERRWQLADWITAIDNAWFSRAFVNRMWSEMVGEGFYEPVDDIGPDREATAPETLDCLSVAFTESGYDIKWLIRTIAATEAYQRESRSRRNPDEPPFAANVAQRLRADQIYNNLQQALELPQQGLAAGRGPYGFNRTPQVLFAQVFGYDPSERRDEVAGSIPQALVLMNSPMVSAFMRAAPGTMLGRVLRDVDSDEDLTVELYLRTLCREPSDKELDACLAHRREATTRGEAFEDVLWSLVNSTEFLHRK